MNMKTSEVCRTAMNALEYTFQRLFIIQIIVFKIPSEYIFSVPEIWLIQPQKVHSAAMFIIFYFICQFFYVISEGWMHIQTW
jgi:hypothetical protein